MNNGSLESRPTHSGCLTDSFVPVITSTNYLPSSQYQVIFFLVNFPKEIFASGFTQFSITMHTILSTCQTLPQSQIISFCIDSFFISISGDRGRQLQHNHITSTYRISYSCGLSLYACVTVTVDDVTSHHPSISNNEHRK
jgi:hypothetical protein